jgi:hypothetical protein
LPVRRLVHRPHLAILRAEEVLDLRRPSVERAGQLVDVIMQQLDEAILASPGRRFGWGGLRRFHGHRNLVRVPRNFQIPPSPELVRVFDSASSTAPTTWPAGCWKRPCRSLHLRRLAPDVGFGVQVRSQRSFLIISGLRRYCGCRTESC